MAKRQHDPVQVIADYLEAKAKNPLLSCMEWCRVNGKPYKYLRKKFGRQMDEALRRVGEKALRDVERKAGRALSETLADAVRVHSGIFYQAAKVLVPAEDDPKGDPLLKPTTYDEAARGVAVATQGMTQVARILHGRDPLLPAEDVPSVVEWSKPRGKQTPSKRKPKPAE